MRTQITIRGISLLIVFIAYVNYCSAQVTLSTSPYTQDFDAISGGLPTGWTVRTVATNSSLGSVATLNTAQIQWSSISGQFANCASANSPASITWTNTQQNASTDRALAVRQSSGFLGSDPGAAFVLQISNTNGLSNFNLSFTLMQLDTTVTAGRTTTWNVDYGIGASPGIFNNATTNPATLTTTRNNWGSTNVTVNFGSALDNIASNVWIRITTKSASTGGGSRPFTAIDDFSLSFINLAAGSPNFQATCAGSNFSIPYYVHNPYSIGNIFTAQLSDSTGSFASPVDIGTHAGISSGTINGTIPANTPQGNGYRIRVIASNPSVIGSDNGNGLVIHALPVVDIIPDCSTLFPNYTTSISSNITGGSLPYTYQWTKSGVNVGTGPTYSEADSGTYVLTVTSLDGCSGVSLPEVITLNISPLNGTYDIPSTCNGFVDINTAVNYALTYGINGNVIFNVAAGHTETAPSGGITINTCGLSPALAPGPSQTLTFQKSGVGANPVISAWTGTSTNIDAIVRIIGGDFITFNGIDVTDVPGNGNGLTSMEIGYALFKCDGNNGSNSNTIKNCSITLHRTITTCYGIYVGNNNQFTTTPLNYSGSSTQSAVDSSRNGKNSFLSNQINDAYMAVYLLGNTNSSGNFSLNDTLNTVGTISEGNIINGFGGGALTSYAVYSQYQKNITVSGNNISGGNGATNVVTGINLFQGKNADVESNTITLNSSALSSPIRGIYCQMEDGTVANPNSIDLKFNTILNCSHLVASSGTFAGITNLVGGTTVIHVENNAIHANTLTGNGTFNAIVNSGAPSLLSIKENTIDDNVKNGTGTMFLIAYGAASNSVIDGNIITNNSMAGGSSTSTFNCIVGIGAGTTYSVVNNQISDNGITNQSSTSPGTVIGISQVSTPVSEIINGNTISKLFIDGALSTDSPHNIYGINVSTTSSSSRNIFGNTVDSIYTPTGVNATVNGILSGAGGVVNIAHNKISNIIPGSLSAAQGLLISSGTTHNIYNNLIGIDVGASSLNSAVSLSGIDVYGSASNVNIYYNTIRLAGSGTGNFGSGGINITSASAVVDIRNNIVVNLTQPGGGSAVACAAALRRSTTSLNNYSLNSNNNIYYSGTPSPSRPIYFNSVTAYATLAAFQTAVSGREGSSKTENVAFQSTTSSSPDFLKISTSVPTIAESHARPITTPVINDDFFGSIRNINYPDIGAHEDNFINDGIIVSTPVLNPATGQCLATNHTVQIDIISGTLSLVTPLLYYFYDDLPGVGSPVSLSNLSGNTWQGIIPSATPTDAHVTWYVELNNITGSDQVIVPGSSYQDNYLNSLFIVSNPVSPCTGGLLQLSLQYPVPVAPAASVYCPSYHPSGCGGDQITFVSLNTLSNSTGSGCGGTEHYRHFNGGGSQTTTLNAASNYSLSVTFGANPFQYFGAWIDYDHNGVYDSSEFLGASANAGANGTASVPFTVPLSSYDGLTHMRIVGGNDVAVLMTDACGNSSSLWGETQDYDITIAGGVATLLPTDINSYAWSFDLSPIGTNNPIVTSASLIPGISTYSVVATDLNGCTESELIDINVFSNGNALITASDTDVCAGAVVHLSAATSFSTTSYDWSAYGGASPGLPVNINTPAIDVNPVGAISTDYYYIVHATETGTSCVSVDTVKVTIKPAVLASAIEFDADECRHGPNSISVTATGGTPPYAGIDTFYVNGGTYTYTVTDAAGCFDTSTVVTIGEFFFNLPDTIIVCTGEPSDISIFGYVVGGSPPFTFTGDTTNLSDDDYTYSAHDSQGCVRFKNTHISIIDCIIPTVTPPDSGKTNDVLSSELEQIYYNPDSTVDSTGTHYIINNGKILIEVVTNVGYYDSVLALIQTPAYGMNGMFANGDTTLIITGFYPVANLLLLNNLPTLINSVRAYNPPISNSIEAGVAVSQGDSSINAGLARTAFGVTGENTKIGVLSDSYNLRPGNPANTDILNGDLPGIGNAYNPNPVEVYGEYPYGNLLDEGRAILQIVHDVAPKAKLAFRSGFVTVGDFADGIMQLQQNGCDFIGDDVTFIHEPFFKDGVVSEAIDYVKSQGVSYFTSAGNFGNRSYESVFTQMNAPAGFSGKAHDFGGGDPFQSVSLVPGLYTIVLQWDDLIYSLGELPGALNDYDIFIVDQSGNKLFGFNKVNTGEDPIEILQFFVLGNVSANIIITRTDQSQDVRFKYVVFRGNLTINEHNTGTSTIVGHADAEGAMTVGAVLYSNTLPYGQIPSIASFSSTGGTTVEGVVREKPDFAGPNGVNTTVDLGHYNFEGDPLPNFFGTSASMPHCMAAASLIKEARKKFFNTTFSPDSLRYLLRASAWDMGPAGFDNSSGYGFVQADSAISRFANPKPLIFDLASDESIIPGTQPFTAQINGRFLLPESEVYMGGVLMPSSFINNTTILFSVPVFTGNPPVQIYNPPITPLMNDGGYSNSKYFLQGTRKTIKIIANNQSKRFGESIPQLTTTILVDDIPYEGTSYTLQDLGLDDMQVTTPANSQSDIGVYLIRASMDPLDPLIAEDEALLEQFDYIFTDGILTVNKLPIVITPRDTTLSYGDKIRNLHFNYVYDDSGIDPGERNDFYNDIRSLHESTLDTAIAFIDDQVSISGRTITSGDLDGMAFLASSRSITNGRAVINRTYFNSLDFDSTIFVDVSPVSVYNYQLDSSNAVLVNGRAVINANAMVNGRAVINNRRMINGTSIVNSLSINDTTNGNVVTIVDTMDVVAPVFDTLPLRSVNLVTGLNAGTHFILPGAFLSNNFDITYGIGTLTIQKSEMIVTPNDTSRYEGENDPVFTATYNRFMYDDDSLDIILPVIVSNATIASPPGNYLITPSGGSADNYYFTYTDGDLNVKPKIALTVKLMIEGFYSGNSMMDNHGAGGYLYVTGESVNPGDVDSVTIVLIEPVTYNEVSRQTGILQTNGDLVVRFGSEITEGESYYIVVNHRQSIVTWSKDPVQINPITTFDFMHY